MSKAVLPALHVHTTKEGSNSYILCEPNGDALLIDPFGFDLSLFRFIEQNGFKLKGVILTALTGFEKGLETLKKIYHVPIYGSSLSKSNDIIDAFKHNIPSVSGYDVRVLPPHSHKNNDVLPIQANRYVFCGQLLVDRIGLNMPERALRHSFLSYLKKNCAKEGENLYLFSSYGPPTTLDAELKMHFDLPRLLEQNMMTT